MIDYNEIDELLIPTIKWLNELGYQTAYSCSGHYSEESYEQKNVDLDFLEQVQNNPLQKVTEIREDSFDLIGLSQITSIYISFQEVYSFENLPNGFELERKTNPGFPESVCVRHTVHFYDEQNQKRPQNEVEEEIKKYCKLLENWANDLPKIEKKGD